MATKPVLDFRLKLEVELRNKTDEIRGVTIEDVYGDNSKGLDIDFNIEKSFETKPTKSTITLYNISSDLYNLIYKEANAFRLFCARGERADYVPFYTGFPVKTVKAAKQTVLTSNEGFMAQDANAGRRGQNDLETTINLMNYGFAKLNKSYQSEVNVDFVIQDCINALGLPKGNIDKILQSRLYNTLLPKGYTSRGDVAITLNDLGNRCGFTWNTNDMQLNLYDKGFQDIKTYGILLTPYNSSTPERQDDKFQARTKTIQKASKKKGIKGIKETTIEKFDQGFKITTQLLPHLMVGSTCFLRDFGMADAEGNKYIYRLRHVGSNTGTNCYTEIYCV